MAKSSWAVMVTGMAIGGALVVALDRAAMDGAIGVMVGACIGRWVFAGRRS